MKINKIISFIINNILQKMNEDDLTKIYGKLCSVGSMSRADAEEIIRVDPNKWVVRLPSILATLSQFHGYSWFCVTRVNGQQIGHFIYGISFSNGRIGMISHDGLYTTIFLSDSRIAEILNCIQSQGMIVMRE